jgi:hypothetical protein
MADAVNAGAFFQSATQQTAVPYKVKVVDGVDGFDQENYLDPQQVKTFQLPEDVNVQRVKKGSAYPINIGLGPVVMEGTAICDGYLLIEPENRFRFFEEAAYDAIFGDQKPVPVEGQILVAVGAPVSCVVLDQEVTFEFLAGDCTAAAGSVLYENDNDNDEDGYTVVPQIHFFRDHLILLG